MQSDPAYIELSTHSCQGVCFTVFKRRGHSYATRATDTRCQGTDYRLRLPAVFDLADCIYTVFGPARPDRCPPRSPPDLPARHPSDVQARPRTRQTGHLRSHGQRTGRLSPLCRLPESTGHRHRPEALAADPDLQPLDPDPTTPASADACLCEPAAFEAPLAQSPWHALVKNDLDTQVFFPNEDAEGYGWYRDLPSITGAACFTPPPRNMTTRPGTLRLAVETRLRTSPQTACRSLPIDTFFPEDGFDFGLARPHDQRFLLVRHPDDLTRHDLTTRLVGAYFESDTDSAADSWSTQLSDAESHARRAATTLLDGEEAAFQETAVLTVQARLSPYLPRGKVCTLTLRRGQPPTIDLTAAETAA